MTNDSIIPAVFRTVYYALAMFVAMWLSGTWMGDTYMTNISLFTLFSLTFELLWWKRSERARAFCYLFCVFGILISGMVLVQQASKVKAYGQQDQPALINK